MKSLAIVSLILFCHLVHAENPQLDYGVQSFVRSFPTGFFLAPQLGIGQKIWHSNSLPHQAINPWYGFLRLSGAAQTSAKVNGLRAEFDIFPISFFGFYAGYDFTVRDLKMQTFDCSRERCSGKITRRYIGSKLALAWKDLLMFGDVRIQNDEFNYKDRPFADERATILCAPGDDDLTIIQSALLWKTTDQMFIGPLYLHNQSEKSRNFSRMKLLALRYQDPPWGLTFGAGTFNSRFSQEIFSVIIGLNWIGDMGVRLF